MKKIIFSWGAGVLIFLVKLLSLLKRFIAAFFVSLIYKFGRVVLRFVFYKIVVKFYKFYLTLINKLGWSGFRNSPLLFLLRQKLVHLTVIAITVIIVFMSITDKARGEGNTDAASKTILSSLVESEFNTPDEEQLVEEFFDEEEAISPVQQKYLNNLSAVKSEPIINTNEPNQIDEENFGIPTNSDGSAMIRPDMASTIKTKRQRTDTVYYTVEAGDVISTIARKFDVRVTTVLWENNLTAYSVIRPGDKLAILPMDGISYEVERGDSLEKIANKYNINKDDILEANGLEEKKGLSFGKKILLPGAKKTSLAKESGGAKSRKSYSGLEMLKGLVNAKDIAKTPNARPAGGKKMNWPTVGYRITQYFSWRHHAVDIANHIGTPIYAADSGRIDIAGWGRGYGNQILINHGGGKQTRYGHLSKFYVGVGDEVEKGEVIGAMGSTGWSTGSHLHFEIIINGVKYNPLNYLR